MSDSAINKLHELEELGSHIENKESDINVEDLLNTISLAKNEWNNKIEADVEKIRKNKITAISSDDKVNVLFGINKVK